MADQGDFYLGDWRIDPASGQIERPGQRLRLEPKLMQLLLLLAHRPGAVVTKEAIYQALWPKVTVGEDSLNRAISKLRKALGDSAGEMQFIETLPKRGYRLLAPTRPAEVLPQTATVKPGTRRPYLLWGAAAMSALSIAAALLLWRMQPSEPSIPPIASQSSQTGDVSRADDFYMRFTRADNEAALSLYEQAATHNPRSSQARAGMANALVQRVIRWPDAPQAGAKTLGEALNRGLNRTPAARVHLQRAQTEAEAALRLNPEDPAALKALGFVYAAKGEFEPAVALYEKAVARDKDAWAALINLGEIHQLQGQMPEAIGYFERAYAAMEDNYAREPQRVGPWQASLGILIAQRLESMGKSEESQAWYQRVLAFSPFQPEATSGLAALWVREGKPGQAHDLCRSLLEHMGHNAACEAILKK